MAEKRDAPENAGAAGYRVFARRSQCERNQAPHAGERRRRCPMQTEELEIYFQGPAGFIGPVGLVVRPKELLGEWDAKKQPAERDAARAVTVVLDEGLVGRGNMICGANKLDYHLRNVTPGKDFQYTIAADVRSVNAGEGCPNCGSPARRYGGRDRAHFQTGLQVFGVDGCARTRPERQRSHSDHGQLRDWHRAHPDGGGRTE